MKTILILTDFSKKADSAAEFSMHMAIKLNANLILCNAMESVLPLSEGGEFTWLPSIRKLQEKRMTNLRVVGNHIEKLIPKDSFKPEITYLTLAGSLAEVTLSILKKHRIELIVSGSHKTGGLLSFLSKSHSHSIMDEIDCPALFIPEGLQFKSLQTISYATDLSFSNAKVMPFLGDLATSFGAAIEVNHITAGDDFSSIAPKRFVEHALRKLMKENHPPLTYNCLKNANVRAALLEMTLSGNTDLLAVVHKKYDFIDSLLHQSISKKLAGTAGIPLLVLPYSFSQNNADFSTEELDRFCYESGDLR